MHIIQNNPDLISEIRALSITAGNAIMEYYCTDLNILKKNDNSPLTKADTASNKIILDGLKILTPSTPIISEEKSDIPFNIRSSWKEYWLVDPLDGTKEFISKNGEFTVNIALILNNKPVFGLIYAPAINEIYWGTEDGSFRILAKNEKEKMSISPNNNDKLTIVTSRSHPDDRLNFFLEKIGPHTIQLKGSSLKFCSVASGTADLYPRFGPTSEWDTAAGEAIVKYAGGNVITFDGRPIQYNCKESYRNPSFFVSSELLAKKINKK